MDKIEMNKVKCSKANNCNTMDCEHRKEHEPNLVCTKTQFCYAIEAYVNCILNPNHEVKE